MKVRIMTESRFGINVIQAVAGKTIAVSTRIKQLHTDVTSHKGTEIVNIVCSVLNKDNQ